MDRKHGLGALVVCWDFPGSFVLDDLAFGGDERQRRRRHGIGNVGNAVLLGDGEPDLCFHYRDPGKAGHGGFDEQPGEQCYEYDPADRVARGDLGNESYRPGQREEKEKQD